MKLIVEIPDGDFCDRLHPMSDFCIFYKMRACGYFQKKLEYVADRDGRKRVHKCGGCRKLEEETKGEDE